MRLERVADLGGAADCRRGAGQRELGDVARDDLLWGASGGAGQVRCVRWEGDEGSVVVQAGAEAGTVSLRELCGYAHPADQVPRQVLDEHVVGAVCVTDGKVRGYRPERHPGSAPAQRRFGAIAIA